MKATFARYIRRILVAYNNASGEVMRLPLNIMFHMVTYRGSSIIALV